MTETTRSFPRTFESDVKWSSAILVRLFVLWAVCSSFDFVTGQDDTVSLTTLDKPSSRVTSRILPSESSVNISSHSLEASGPFAKNVSTYSSPSPDSPLNQTSILTILRSLNFSVVGSTEPISSALPFTTSPANDAHPSSAAESVHSLRDSSSLPISGLSKLSSLSVFTSRALSDNSNSSSLVNNGSVSISRGVQSSKSTTAGTNDSSSWRDESVTLRSNNTLHVSSSTPPQAGSVQGRSLGSFPLATHSETERTTTRISISFISTYNSQVLSTPVSTDLLSYGHPSDVTSFQSRSYILGKSASSSMTNLSHSVIDFITIRTKTLLITTAGTFSSSSIYTSRSMLVTSKSLKSSRSTELETSFRVAPTWSLQVFSTASMAQSLSLQSLQMTSKKQTVIKTSLYEPAFTPSPYLTQSTSVASSNISTRGDTLVTFTASGVTLKLNTSPSLLVSEENSIILQTTTRLGSASINQVITHSLSLSLEASETIATSLSSNVSQSKLSPQGNYSGFTLSKTSSSLGSHLPASVSTFGTRLSSLLTNSKPHHSSVQSQIITIRRTLPSEQLSSLSKALETVKPSTSKFFSDVSLLSSNASLQNTAPPAVSYSGASISFTVYKTKPKSLSSLSSIMTSSLTSIEANVTLATTQPGSLSSLSSIMTSSLTSIEANVTLATTQPDSLSSLSSIMTSSLTSIEANVTLATTHSDSLSSLSSIMTSSLTSIEANVTLATTQPDSLSSLSSIMTSSLTSRDEVLISSIVPVMSSMVIGKTSTASHPPLNRLTLSNSHPSSVQRSPTQLLSSGSIHSLKGGSFGSRTSSLTSREANVTLATTQPDSLSSLSSIMTSSLTPREANVTLATTQPKSLSSLSTIMTSSLTSREANATPATTQRESLSSLSSIMTSSLTSREANVTLATTQPDSLSSLSSIMTSSLTSREANVTLATTQPKSLSSLSSIMTSSLTSREANVTLATTQPKSLSSLSSIMTSSLTSIEANVTLATTQPGSLSSLSSIMTSSLTSREANVTLATTQPKSLSSLSSIMTSSLTSIEANVTLATTQPDSLSSLSSIMTSSLTSIEANVTLATTHSDSLSSLSSIMTSSLTSIEANVTLATTQPDSLSSLSSIMTSSLTSRDEVLKSSIVPVMSSMVIGKTSTASHPPLNRLTLSNSHPSSVQRSPTQLLSSGSIHSLKGGSFGSRTTLFVSNETGPTKTLVSIGETDVLKKSSVDDTAIYVTRTTVEAITRSTEVLSSLSILSPSPSNVTSSVNGSASTLSEVSGASRFLITSQESNYLSSAHSLSREKSRDSLVPSISRGATTMESPSFGIRNSAVPASSSLNRTPVSSSSIVATPSTTSRMNGSQTVTLRVLSSFTEAVKTPIVSPTLLGFSSVKGSSNVTSVPSVRRNTSSVLLETLVIDKTASSSPISTTNDSIGRSSPSASVGVFSVYSVPTKLSSALSATPVVNKRESFSQSATTNSSSSSDLSTLAFGVSSVSSVPRSMSSILEATPVINKTDSAPLNTATSDSINRRSFSASYGTTSSVTSAHSVPVNMTSILEATPVINKTDSSSLNTVISDSINRTSFSASYRITSSVTSAYSVRMNISSVIQATSVIRTESLTPIATKIHSINILSSLASLDATFSEFRASVTYDTASHLSRTLKSSRASSQPKATDVVSSETVISYGTQNTTILSSQTALLVNASSSLKSTWFAFLSSRHEGVSSPSVARTSGIISIPTTRSLSPSRSVYLNASKLVSSAIELSLSSSSQSSIHTVSRRSQASQKRSLSLNESSFALPVTTTSLGHSAVSMTMSLVVSTLDFTASPLLPLPSTIDRTSSGGLSTAVVKNSSSLALSLVITSSLTPNVTLLTSVSPSRLKESTDLAHASSVTKAISISSNPTAETIKSVHPNSTKFPDSSPTSFSFTSVYQVTTTQSVPVALASSKSTSNSLMSKLIPSAASSLAGLPTFSLEGSIKNITTIATKSLRTMVSSTVSPIVSSLLSGEVLTLESKATRTGTNLSGSLTRYPSIGATPSALVNLTLSSTFARDRTTSLLQVSSSKSMLDVSTAVVLSSVFGSTSTLEVSTLQYFSSRLASSRPFITQSFNSMRRPTKTSSASMVLPDTSAASLSSVVRHLTTSPEGTVNPNVSTATTTTTSASTSFDSAIPLSSSAQFSSSSVTIFLRTSFKAGRATTLTETLVFPSPTLKDSITFQSSLATKLPSMLKSVTSPFTISSSFRTGSSAGSFFVATGNVGSSFSTRVLHGTTGSSAAFTYLSSSSTREQQSFSTETSHSRSSVEVPSSKRVTSLTGSAFSEKRSTTMMVTTSSSVVVMETSRSSIPARISSQLGRSQVPRTIVRISSVNETRPLTGSVSSPRSSDKVLIKSSPVTVTLRQSMQPMSSSVGTTSLDTNSEVRAASRDPSGDVTKATFTGSLGSASSLVSRHLVISTTTSLLSSFAKDTITKSQDKSFTLTSSSPSVVLPTVDPDSNEGIVGIQILVPTSENEMNDSFREALELNLATAYRWGLEKADSRKRRDLGWVVKDDWAPDQVVLTMADLPAWKRSAAYKMHETKSRRFRRQADNIAAVVTTIRRALPIVGEEIVDVYYRMFDGLTMLSAENIVDTTNRLSEGELVVAMKYGVTLRPYVAKEVPVTEAPTKAEGGTKLSVLIPAIIVPLVVALFLILALLWIKCVAKRKRDRLKVNPEKGPTYKNLEVRVSPTNDLVPPKKPGNVYAAPARNRASTSSKSSGDVPTKSAVPPPPEYPVMPGQKTKPNRKYRRRRAAEYNGEATDRGIGKRRGKVERQRPSQVATVVTDNIEMKHLAGVVENRPQMKEEKLAQSQRHDESVSVRFAPLPPLVARPLVGPRPSSSVQKGEENRQREKIITESGVPQTWLAKMQMIDLQRVVETDNIQLNEDDDTINLKANVERWRNKMRHREKLPQEIREKERKRDNKLRNLEEEEDEIFNMGVEDPFADSLERSLTAERKRRSRLDRWRHNRVGTSSSKTSSSERSSSSSSSSSESDLEKGHKNKKERRDKKAKQGKGKKDRVKEPNNLPRLVSGTGSKAASMEMAWTVKEMPGVRLVAVRPREENTESWQPPAPEPVYAQNRLSGYKAPQHRPTSSRSQRKDRTQYLLETGFPVVPLMPTPALVHPTTDEYFEDDGLYEDMEELDPNVPQYDEAVVIEDESTSPGFPNRPKEAFGGPALYENDHIYDEPIFSPVSLPQTSLVYPEHKQLPPRVLVPSRDHGGMPLTASGRPRSAARRPGSARPARSARPTSARRDALAQYARPLGIHSQYDRNAEPTSVPNPRYVFGSRPTVATAPQPSIGTSPRYMVAPGGREQPQRSVFGNAGAILSRAQANADRFERDSKHGTFSPSTVQPRHTTGSEAALRPTNRQAPSTNSRFEQGAMERAELEAQLLVSRALARARNNVRT